MSLEKWTEHIWVAKLANDPAFTDDMDGLSQALATAAATPDVVLDLAGLTNINSSNLSALLQVRKQMIQGEAKLMLAGPGDAVWAVLLSTGLDKIFSFTPDVATALASLNIDPNPS